MKVLVPLVCALFLASSSALASDGQVPSQTLSQMGLGNMTVLSDAQGDRIRGRSIAIVSGSATVGSTTKSYFLVNSNFAIGGKIVISGGSFAAGGSFAIAH